MDKKEFKELMEEGRSRFSIEQNTVLREEAEDQLGEKPSPQEVIKQKVKYEKGVKLPERYHKARRIRRKFKECRAMVQGDEYDVDIDSDLANQVVEELEDIDERSADLGELEDLKILVEKFIVEEKDIESPELENHDEA